MFGHLHQYKKLLMATDIIITLMLFTILVELRPYLPGKPINVAENLVHPSIYVILALFWHMFFALAGVYDEKRIADLSTQLSRFSSSYIPAILMFAGILFFAFRETSRMLIIYLGIFNYAALIIARYCVAFHIFSSRAHHLSPPAIIVGTCENAGKIFQTLNAHDSSLLRIVGFIGDTSHSKNLPAPILGSLDELSEVINKFNIELVILALTEQNTSFEKVVSELERLPVRVYLVPDIFNLALVNAEVESLGEVVMIGIREPVIKGHQMVCKRIMDVTLSSLFLIVLSPIFLLIWIAVKLDSSGAAIYIAERVGENGKKFRMLKFRTMVSDSENNQPSPVNYDHENRPIFKTRNDPRITRVGKVLRRLSLDELPQLINVLRGDMSLVGPRPEQPFITQGYEPWQFRRLSVPPGITGWWQVNGRSDKAMHLNSHYDMYYIRNYSVLLDMQILFKTIAEVIKGRGAY